jgi:hypothetical protein
MKATRAVVAVGVLCGTIDAVAGSTTFPGSVDRTKDPTGRFEIRWSEPHGGASHQLLFAELKYSSATPFLSFERSVTIHWSPSGDRFAVTERAGSDNSHVIVFTAPPTRPVRLLPALPSRVRALVEGNHHAYVETVAWTPGGLAIHAHGYGDRSPKGFSVFMQCRERREAWYCRQTS